SSFQAKPLPCSGFEACKLAFLKAAKGIGDFNFIEGMACEGGCVQGPAQLIRSPKNQGDVDRHAKQAEGRTIESAISDAEKDDSADK
ncbi:[Fe-Fe] hydrogenase large subunit C-terminal domain-containing protein, partial [uncultured Flavonifractor sp.]